jgi:hypothetical protein
MQIKKEQGRHKQFGRSIDGGFQINTIGDQSISSGMAEIVKVGE